MAVDALVRSGSNPSPGDYFRLIHSYIVSWVIIAGTNRKSRKKCGLSYLGQAGYDIIFFLKYLAGQIYYDNHGFADNVCLSNKMIGPLNKILQICFYFGKIMLN